jgi:penicillin-binding protein 2
MVTALAALEAGVATPETKVSCPGYIEFGGRRFHCWKRGGHGT